MTVGHGLLLVRESLNEIVHESVNIVKLVIISRYNLPAEPSFCLLQILCLNSQTVSFSGKVDLSVPNSEIYNEMSFKPLPVVQNFSAKINYYDHTIIYM